MAKKPRGRETARDMIWSMGVVLGLVAIILAITWRSKPDAVRVIDYKSVISQVQGTAPWPLLVPSEVPSDWRSTSARLEAEDSAEIGNVRWYLGFITSDEKFVASWQTDGELKKVIKTALPGASCESTPNPDGWTPCELRDGETRALVRTDDKYSVIVYGTVPSTVLSTYAMSLSPAK